MKAFTVVIVIIALFVPLTHGLVFENIQHKDEYTSPGNFKFFMKINSNNLTSSPTMWATWNTGNVWVFNNTTQIRHLQLSGIEKVWLGSHSIAVLTHNGLKIMDINTNRTSQLRIRPLNLEFGTSYAVAHLKHRFVAINLTNYHENPIPQARRTYITNKLLILTNNTTITAWNGKTVWKLDTASKIIDLYTKNGDIYALLKNRTEIISTSGKTLKFLPITGEKIIVYEKRILTYSKFLGDDEGKVWGFRIYHLNGTIINSFSVYMKPEKLTPIGEKVLFNTRKMIHIIVNDSDYVANNTFKKIVFTDSTIVGINSSKIFTLPTSTLILRFKGHDNDLDWIIDKNDPDDDNDGMPDWWEIKYGLNPDNPADRNEDPDHDGLTNYQEYLNGTDPHNWDTDGDGLSDGYEVANGLNPLVPNPNPEPSMRVIVAMFLVVFAILFIMGSKKEEN
ncbi:MAG: hypothetical protein GXO25_07640 [Euryarchaeota archaeon]|nr:hypothetical protein [Euryarchaeota archaeon]